MSTTAYKAASLTARARALLTSSGAPLHDLSAQAPSIRTDRHPDRPGELPRRDPGGQLEQGVSVDLATYAGKPAAIIVTRSGGVAVA